LAAKSGGPILRRRCEARAAEERALEVHVALWPRQSYEREAVNKTVAIVREPAVASSSYGYTAEIAKFFHAVRVRANTKLDKNDAA
jgi:hypothetical protein